jgi:hypothetical protein
MSEDQYASLDQLFGPRAATPSGMPEDDVEVTGLGLVRVRGLSRDEALSLRGIAGRAESERALLAFAMVSPRLTPAQVARWQAASPAGEMEPVTDKVAELSGMLDDSAKQAVKDFEANPEAEFRVFSGGQAGDAGGGPSGADE